ncbi:MAG TPA: [acyl-carrier-protein] S-malonyltransferase [Dehalococcoidia bacterium]|nr:[acyl-carrier-protein] S-malonyltransferase [Chloroflexota bacterium]HCE75882.1 [acyl-carrier-protein] S-malonyltransferase [Dehalococcoidia bacterium]|tara:strand:- start:2379 stop:3329 length:951 start_codon:yes stop_codon:yes gene_type:complete
MTLTFAKNSKTAFLFPGQGAQAVGMGLDLYKESDSGKEVFDMVDEALGRSLSKIMFEGPEDELRETRNAQPGIMAMSLACIEVMKSNVPSEAIPIPYLMAGHSLGEYTALAAAGVLSVMDTAKLVQERSELMQHACDSNPGTMAAILGLDEMVLQEVARESGVFISNINTQDQIVISGEKMSVARAMDMSDARGAKKVIPLKVGGAFHSGLMEPAKAGLVDFIDGLKFNDPEVPIIANCTGTPLHTGEEIKGELISQISGCVQWKKSVDFMIKSGIDNFLEIGPGRALGGMVKKIDRGVNVASVNDIESIVAISRN